MKEDFLHLLWQQQLHARQLVKLTNGQPLTILKTGYRNSNSGPDFEQAKIVIDQLEWIGSVEIHVKASEWNAHGHTKDPAYQSVILHVVWEMDSDVFRLDGSLVPTLELKDIIPLEVILRYRELMNPSRLSIACEPFLKDMASIRMTSMQERVLTERLERKAGEILNRFLLNKKDWPETFYQSLAFALGLKINSEPMLVLAQSLPLKIFASQGWKQEKVFALVLGQAGFLNEASGPITRELKKEYLFLASKYQLNQNPLAWKKFRIRPGAFPAQRVATFASLIPALRDWFQMLSSANSPKDFFLKNEDTEHSPVVLQLFEELEIPPSKLALSSFLQQALAINFLAPMLTAIGLNREDSTLIEKALDWLSLVASEPNSTTRMWEQFGVECKDAGQSQALNELYNQYCLKKRCMECSLGIFILGKGEGK